MKVNFKDCLTETLIHEGGYSNHPKDPGGKTQWGIIQRVYNSYRRLKQQSARDVRQITKREMEDIYKTFYWDKVDGDVLPIGLDMVVFDFAVNSGHPRSIKFLQKAINKVEGRSLKADGLMGPATLDAATSIENLPGVISEMCDARLGWLHTLKTFGVFGKGWSRRVKAVKARGLEMAQSGLRIIEERPEVPPALGMPGDAQLPSAAPVAVSMTGLVGALGAGLVSAVNNPFALCFMLALLAAGGLVAFKYAQHIRFNS
jgi:lysozyme family protein